LEEVIHRFFASTWILGNTVLASWTAVAPVETGTRIKAALYCGSRAAKGLAAELAAGGTAVATAVVIETILELGST
jgi:hypothetical protein